MLRDDGVMSMATLEPSTIPTFRQRRSKTSRYPDLTVGRCFYAVTWLGDVIKRAGSLDTAKVIKAWEGSKFKTAWEEEDARNPRRVEATG